MERLRILTRSPVPSRTQLPHPQKSAAAHTFRAVGSLLPKEGVAGGRERKQKGDGLKGMNQFLARLSWVL